MDRRSFTKQSVLGSLALSLGYPTLSPSSKSHILTLSFDDGFKKSFYKIAQIHEEVGLKACFNVIASGHLPGFKAVGQWILPELLGNFDDWNALKHRGHEVMPHSWTHVDKTSIPFDHAKELILQCLEYFKDNLDGYDPKYAVYNFPFNASTLELDTFTLQHVGAVRTGGWNFLSDNGPNPIPTILSPLRLGCWSYGPDNGDQYVEKTINQFLESAGGWLILNLHGLDDEGWGPVSTDYLISLLKRLVKLNFLEVMPTGEVLKRI